ncbi:MAG: CPBP family intramembrane metalloprotease [Bacteroidales bacterium]|nr:CPBP family intramembrane metalloprotease [Bacteroidales bacterium]
MFKNFGFIAKLLTLILLSLISVVAALFVAGTGGLLYAKLNGMTTAQLSDDGTYLRVFQILTSLIMFVIPAAAYSKLFDHNIKEGLYLDRRPPALLTILAIITMVSALPLSNLLSIINSHLTLPDCMSGIETWMRNKEDSSQALVAKIIITDSFAVYLFNIATLALIPAISEELFFRATVQKLISGSMRQQILAAIITAVIFSAIHMQFYGFLPRFMLGFMLGFMLICTKSIYVPIMAHFVNNFIAITYSYITGEFMEEPQNQELSTLATISVLSTIVVTILLVTQWKISHSKKYATKSQDNLQLNK